MRYINLQKKLLIDVGSTYFKVYDNGDITHYFRNFSSDIYNDLIQKCDNIISKYSKNEVFICSSANGGLSTLIIGLSESFSLKYATNIAYNSGINIIDSILFSKINDYPIPSDSIDVVIIAGGIDGVTNIFDEKLFRYLDKINYNNIVYVGAKAHNEYLSKNIKNLKLLGNILSNKLQMVEDNLKEYLTNLYQEDIIGKDDIKELYNITSNQIYSTPYVVNQTLPYINEVLEVVDPFIVVDIGGATTDIHYSKELVEDNIITQNEYDRLVFKKLGVYKSVDSLVFSAKNNEFVYELLTFLNKTEDILDKRDKEATTLLMQLAIFLVLYKVSHMHQKYLNIKLNSLKSIVFTGGITKVLNHNEVSDIVSFFYKKILNYHIYPTIVIDTNYQIWTLNQNLV
jgi:mRNA-degrading endonuclease HigB of HigAB toxin-antitoxin module